MGMSVSDATRLFLKCVVADQAFPFKTKVPDADTRSAMAEADEIAAMGKARFAASDDLMADLGKAGRKSARGRSAPQRLHQTVFEGL